MNIEQLKTKYKKGVRVKLISMEGEPQMPEGLNGVVTLVDDMGQIHVEWENGSTLALNIDCDSFIVAEDE